MNNTTKVYEIFSVSFNHRNVRVIFCNQKPRFSIRDFMHALGYSVHSAATIFRRYIPDDMIENSSCRIKSLIDCKIFTLLTVPEEAVRIVISRMSPANERYFTSQLDQLMLCLKSMRTPEPQTKRDTISILFD